MDHRAIVWCHGLLDQVRNILWIQSQPLITQQEQRDRIVEMLGTVDYDQALNDMRSHLLVSCWLVVILPVPCSKIC